MTAVIVREEVGLPAPERSPRERIVYSCAQLVRAQGVTGTGLREVVAKADAPRGSLQHYFPAGKDQIVREAIAWSGSFAAERVEQYFAEMRTPTPGGLFAAMAGQWQAEFTARGFAAGCPLVAAAADVAASDGALREAIRDAFDAWLAPVADALRRMGVPPARARSLALVMISALEGAIVLARTHEDLTPLATVVRELRPLLDGAAR
jgi:AcrR family transcriptional regulator